MTTRQPPPLSRRYGYFLCTDCEHGWESSQVYCVRGTKKVYYRQACRLCREKIFPYDTERLKCNACGMQDCQCSHAERKARARHVDPSKRHMAEFCDKCLAGYPCQRDDDDDDDECNCDGEDPYDDAYDEAYDDPCDYAYDDACDYDNRVNDDYEDYYNSYYVDEGDCYEDDGYSY